QHQQKVASDRNGYLVVWRDQNNGDIQGAGVSAAGEVLHPAGIVISRHAQAKQDPAIASCGDGYRVSCVAPEATLTSFDIYGARVTSAGVTEDPGGLPIGVAPNVQQRPAVAADGAGYLVVWQDLRNGGIDIYGTNVLGSEVGPFEGIPFASTPDS